MDNGVGNKYLWLIELLAFWQGRVNSQDLCNVYGISTTQAKKYISDYKIFYPSNIVYDKSVKAHIPDNVLKCELISGDVNEYLDWLNTQNDQAEVFYNSITHAELRLPPRHTSPEIMRGLITAIRHQRRIDVEYLSLSKTSAEGRVIQPHTFVKTGLRWHLRGYCEYRCEYRDFVLSRFRGAPFLLGAATHTRTKDEGWNTNIIIRLQPDPRFTPDQKTIIEQDYQMQNGELLITTKAALAQYVIQGMQVRTDSLAKTPQQQQLVLVNEDDLNPWLFAS